MIEIVNEIRVRGKKKILPAQVIMLVADSNYTQIYFEDGTKILVSMTLGKVQTLLDTGKNFIRIHRSFVVNRNFIENFDSSNIYLPNKQAIHISRRRLLNFKESMSVIA
jgi:DNA-binding LytR/AlgR family response regulator